MLPLIYAYLCVPGRFRFIVRWLAAGFVLVILILVLILFARIILTMPMNHRNFFHPESHHRCRQTRSVTTHHQHRLVITAAQQNKRVVKQSYSIAQMFRQWHTAGVGTQIIDDRCDEERTLPE
jgi:hypothetical protein